MLHSVQRPPASLASPASLTYLRQAFCRIFGAIGVAATVIFVRAGAAVGQVSGETSEIPENAPTNWSIEFIGWPLLFAAVILVLVCAAAYTWRSVRLRHPAPS